MRLTGLLIGLAAGILMGSAALAQDVAGDWDGALNISAAMKLRVLFHIAHGPDGLTADFQSIDQGPTKITASSVTQSNGEVKIDIAAIGGGFDGSLDPDGRTLTGTWRQSAQTFPLVLTRRAAGTPAPAAHRRPQTPQKPYPYREEDVVYPGAPGLSLAGTLTLPTGPGPFPAVVLISGSGPNKRDEEAFGHKLFLVLADHMTRHGIAVLRYDKRGLGGSSGDYPAATSADFADDAEASAAYLRNQPQIDPRHVGLIGHSEGGLVAPMVAVRDPKIAFIVLMAGPGLRGDQILLKQQRLIGRAMGVPEAALDKGAEVNRKLYAALDGAKDQADAEAKARTALAGAGLPPEAMEKAIQQSSSNWIRFFLTYDPAPTLAQVRCPVLAVNGSKDLQVPPKEDLAAIKAALVHNPNVRTIELEGLNHLFQTAPTGAPSEYAQIEETMSPRALDTVTAWIKDQVR